MSKYIFHIKNIILSVILCVAGITHLVSPNIYLVSMPPYIPYHFELIILTGILEIIFAFGIIYRPVIRITSKLLALYFLAILPAHIHVSLNGIEIFGISSKFLLWSRTVFQGVFIYWAIMCGKIDQKQVEPS